ncbi:Oidioi.mRNA.OKI2018_I69.PAR.g8793.t1.cds [Oikopleura dioica]|uniref:Oidioi.mRNA.OKI2018_I69.PAR.g8793.t1.cds n=1 Tax=Oikopleura dioica TaxID=34765 RepID=A0ABN7RQ30_OIKDI|nr:Oidioi.mRNA.OKI2018_I69.PAR.g8793.t1.cds [Oikopleura dioica]
MENKDDLIFKTYKPKLTNFAWWIEFAKICAFCVTIISIFLYWHFKKESAPKGQLEKEDKTNYENDKRSSFLSPYKNRSLSDDTTSFLFESLSLNKSK